MITQQRLKELLHYDPESGWFTNLVQRGQRGTIGAVAGNHDKDGYIVIQIGGRKYRAGRLAWLYMTGEWPTEVDHWDGVYDNDSWSNLRDGTHADNMANSNRATGMSGLRGVNRDPRNPTKWRSRVSYGNCRQWLGPFDSPEEAYEAYLKAVEHHHGEFAFHKRPQTLERRI